MNGRDLLLLMCTVIIVLVLLECSMRIMSIEPGWPQGLFVEDNVTNYGLASNFVGRMWSGEYDVGISTNSLGLRDDEVGNGDIVFLGDSFVFGWGVEHNESVSEVFQNLTGLDVVNVGVPGFGTSHELFQLLKLGLDASRVYLFFYANDYADSVRGLDKKEWVYDGYRIENELTWKKKLKVWLYTHSRAYLFFGKRARMLMTGLVPLPVYNDSVIEPGTVEKIVILQELFTFNLLLKDRLIVVLVPTRDCDDYKTVREYMDYTGIKYVYPKEMCEHPEYFFKYDRHWNAAGHKYIAEYLYENT